MERMIQITPSMFSVPATSSIHHQPDELATLLRNHYATAFQILPKEMTKPVRMYYDFDGEHQRRILPNSNCRHPSSTCTSPTCRLMA